jgi:hypothetical protein
MAMMPNSTTAARMPALGCMAQLQSCNGIENGQQNMTGGA